MTTHTVPRKTNPTRIQLRKRTKDRLGQLIYNITVHIITVIVGSLGSINVEASTAAKVVCIVLALNVQTA